MGGAKLLQYHCEENMATYNEQLQKIWHEYERAGNSLPASPRDVARWAIDTKRWLPRPTDIISQCAEELARAAREEYRTDPYGRRYRALHAVRSKQGSLWADIDTAPRKHMEKAFAQRRKQIVGDCHQLKVDVDHYNRVEPNKEPIQLILDFTDDVAEIEAMEDAKYNFG